MGRERDRPQGYTPVSSRATIGLFEFVLNRRDALGPKVHFCRCTMVGSVIEHAHQ